MIRVHRVELELVRTKKLASAVSTVSPVTILYIHTATGQRLSPVDQSFRERKREGRRREKVNATASKIWPLVLTVVVGWLFVAKATSVCDTVSPVRQPATQNNNITSRRHSPSSVL